MFTTREQTHFTNDIALFLPLSRHNSPQLEATRGTIPQLGKSLTPLG
jgi:hypothetical protein